LTTDSRSDTVDDLTAEDVAILTAWSGSDRLRREWEEERQIDRCLADLRGVDSWPVPVELGGES
jgi:hypothetical protein